MCAFAVLMDNRPIDKEAANILLQQLNVSAFDKASIYYYKDMAFIQGLRFNTIESYHEVLPYHDKTHGLIIVSDCFLTNRETLIAKLELQHSSFVLTDSQIILHAYLKWQEQCAMHLEGDIQFAIWDDKTEKLFVVTNRIPDRFTYVYQANHTLCVSTQLPPLRYYIKHTLKVLKFNYNNFKKNIMPRSSFEEIFPIYDNVIKMQYGTYLMYQKNQLKEHTYWDLNQFQGINTRPYHTSIVEEFRELYTSVLQKRLKRLKDPIACQFSGGLDSTLLLQTLHTLQNKDDKLTGYLCHLDTKLEENIFKSMIKSYGKYQLPQNFLDYHFANKQLLDIINKDFSYADIYYISANTFKTKTAFELADWVYSYCDSNTTNIFLINQEMATRHAMQSHQNSLLFTGYFGNAVHSWDGKIDVNSATKNDISNIKDKQSNFSVGYQKNVINAVEINRIEAFKPSTHLEMICDEFWRKQNTNTFLSALDHLYAITSIHSLADPALIAYCLSLPKEAYIFENYNRRLARDLLTNILHDRLRLTDYGVMSNITGGNITYLTPHECQQWTDLLNQHKNFFQDLYDFDSALKYLNNYSKLSEHDKMSLIFKNNDDPKKYLIHVNFVWMLFFFKWLCLEHENHSQNRSYDFKIKELII